MSRTGKDPNEILMGRADSVMSSMMPRGRQQQAEEPPQEVPPVMTRASKQASETSPAGMEKLTISLPANLKWEFDDIVLQMKRDAKRRGESDRVSASSVVRGMIEQFVRENRR